MGSSIGVPSEFSRSSVGGIEEGIREVKETAILRIGSVRKRRSVAHGRGNGSQSEQ